ncbi:hypothetical protein JGH11_16025 [Dysgonomonas sp. Marseille-P4677]|uniref:hypothetical protein n=1 Tax=Dysgonomonas sp. Marseille-P4677 TaxID=2364790 RepID=UPI0019135629|nr:hypothetical protein [Dysgonomonas sp. Marseille-P4677]MBK5722384.1 hypothetical protein [Dysgonomonas sp. Marseille-P4677]
MKKTGIKSQIKNLKKGESYLFERKRYSSIRNTLHVLRVENPDRAWTSEIKEDGILVTCDE